MSAPTRAEKVTEATNFVAATRKAESITGYRNLASDCADIIEGLVQLLAAADAREQQVRDLLKLVRDLWHGTSGGPPSEFAKAQKRVDEALAIIGDKP